ncbi:MAG: hypothetical protein MJA83_05605 [Gammaproteobacteria bacterium]|nr:hypothetical protein [Gammaproteobacteria bacterium]
MSRLRATIARLGRMEGFEVSRPGGGEDVKGEWKRNRPSVFEANGSIQQADAQTLMLLPEGLRNQETVVVHTDCELRSEDVGAQRQADRLKIRGRIFQVERLFDYSREGGFFEAICVRLGQ